MWQTCLCTPEVYVTPVKFFYQSNFWIYLLLQPPYNLRQVSVFLKQGEICTRWPTVISSNIACSVRWGSHKIFRAHSILEQASVSLCWNAQQCPVWFGNSLSVYLIALVLSYYLGPQLRWLQGWRSNIRCIDLRGKRRWGWFGHIQSSLNANEKRNVFGTITIQAPRGFQNSVLFYNSNKFVSYVGKHCEKWMSFTAFRTAVPNPVR